MKGHLALATMAMAGPAWAEIKADSWQYSCDRGVVITVAYLSDEDSAAAVLTVEGRQVALILETDSEETSRFVSPFETPGYVWLSGISDGTLLWQDGGQETLLLTCGAMQ